MPRLGLGLGLGFYSVPLGGALETLILDTVTALYGYSLRKLKSSATKSIRVRRSSDNAEQDIGFVGENLDESALTTFVGAGDGFVITMYNQVNDGASQNLTQATTTVQPLVVIGGSVVKRNLKASLDFTTSGTVRLGSDIVQVQPSTTCFVLEPRDKTVAGRLLFGGSIYDISSSRYRTYCGTSFVQSSVLATNALCTVSNHANGASSNVVYNGTVTTGNAGTRGLINPNVGHSGASWQGYISEVVILPSDTDREAIRLSQTSFFAIV